MVNGRPGASGQREGGPDGGDARDVLARLATTVAGRLAASVAGHKPGGALSPETLG